MYSIASGKIEIEIEIVKSFETKEQHETISRVSIVNAGKYGLKKKTDLFRFGIIIKRMYPKLLLGNGAIILSTYR
jgi:hypothetical protein